MLRGAVISMLDCEQSELGTGWGNYVIFLLVSPFVSLMIAKFSFVRILLNYLVCIFFHVDKLRKHYNFTEL